MYLHSHALQTPQIEKLGRTRNDQTKRNVIATRYYRKSYHATPKHFGLSNRSPLPGSPKQPSTISKDSIIINAANAFLSTNLAHMVVDVSISGHEDDAITLMALHDSGCEKSIMSKKAFDRIVKSAKQHHPKDDT